MSQKSDLISREEVLRTIITAGECEPDLGYAHLHKVVENIPSADAVATFRTGQTYGKSTSIRELVEVVRCKDCKHRRENCGMGDHRWCDVLKMTTREDDFCSYGKRREP